MSIGWSISVPRHANKTVIVQPTVSEPGGCSPFSASLMSAHEWREMSILSKGLECTKSTVKHLVPETHVLSFPDRM